MHVSVRIINQHPRGQGDSRNTMRGYEKKYNYFIRYVMYFVLELLLLIELFTWDDIWSFFYFI